MRVGMLAPISWRVPPRHYGPWELVVSLLTEGLVERGVDVTLFATADSVTSARLDAVCPRPLMEDPSLDAKVWEALHLANAFEHAGALDLVHNHYDFLPLTYSRLISTPLVIAGIVHDREYFDREIAPRLDGEAVRYVGPIGPRDRDTLLGSAVAILHLVEFPEPFGLSMIEAMACGTPVIARRRGSVPEVIDEGVTGFVVDDVAGAIAAVDRARSLDRRGVRTRAAERFSRDRMVDDYLRVYERVLAGAHVV
ncbi:MAG: glycosyltransferase family 4 protein [Chloroflexi bacterium]|nr:MAG: glycosyltransferase family 4 protein [Chloroflexota bacterium]